MDHRAKLSSVLPKQSNGAIPSSPISWRDRGFESLLLHGPLIGGPLEPTKLNQRIQRLNIPYCSVRRQQD
jgi:hypothetical protein